MVDIDVIFDCEHFKGYRQVNFLWKDYFSFTTDDTQSVLFWRNKCVLFTVAYPKNRTLGYLTVLPKTIKSIKVKVAGRFNLSGNFAVINNVQTLIEAAYYKPNIEWLS